MRGTAGSTLRYRLNNWSAGVVAAVVLLTPVALGGNRPAIWALSALCLFAWGAIYFGRLGFARAQLRATASNYRLLAGLFWVLSAYMVVQILPIAGLLPGSWLSLPGNADPGMRISLAPGDTALGLLRWLSYGMLFYLCLQIGANSSRSTAFVKVLFWIVVAHAFYGLVLFFEFEDAILFTEKWAYRGVATGGFVNRNSYATFLAMGAVIGVVLLSHVLFAAPEGVRSSRLLEILEGRNGAILLFAGLLVIAVTLALTASRMGFAAAACGILAVVVLTVLRKQHRLGVGAVASGALLAAVLLACLLFLYGGNLVDRLSSIETGANVRADLYRQVWAMIADRPLLGFGGSSFEYAFPLYHEAPVSLDKVWDKAHSTYLSLWVDYGLLLGSIPLVMVAWCLVQLVGILKNRASEPAAVAAVGAVVAAAVHSTVDFSLEIQGVAYLFVAVLAAGLGALARRPRDAGATFAKV